MKVSIISTDVLVVGSGGAGLRAAIEARKKGANAYIVTKGRMGLTSCTSIANGIFRVSKGEGEILRHYQETFEARKFLNNKNLVRVLVNNAWRAVKELKSYGVKVSFEKEKVGVVGDGYPIGIYLSKALSDYALRTGVNVHEETMIFDLVVEDHKCIGALAFMAGAELRDLEFVQFLPMFIDEGVTRIPTCGLAH